MYRKIRGQTEHLEARNPRFYRLRREGPEPEYLSRTFSQSRWCADVQHRRHTHTTRAPGAAEPADVNRRTSLLSSLWAALRCVHLSLRA